MTQRLPLLLIAAALFGLDRWSKRAIESSMDLYSSKEIIPGFFDLVHTRNTGIAFSLFADAGPAVKDWILPIVSVLAVGLIVTMLWKSEPGVGRSSVALTLILAGAAGNLYDRVMYGFVVDFLDVYVGSWHWPAFNVADSCITAGAALLLLDAWAKSPADEETAEAAS